MHHRRLGLLVVAVLLVGCGRAVPTAHPTSTPTPTPTPVVTPVPLVDTCVIGTWISEGALTGPSGKGLSGLIIVIQPTGQAVLTVNELIWNPRTGDPQEFQGSADIRIHTSATGTTQMLMTDDSEDDSNVIVTDQISGNPLDLPAAGIWSSALYTCGPNGLSVVFDTPGGLLAGASATFTH